MLLTETNARKQWCPYARALRVETAEASADYVRLAAASYNRNDKGIPTTFCLGATCMAWRWEKALVVIAKTIKYTRPDRYALYSHQEPERPANVPADFVWRGNDYTGGEGSWWEEPEDQARARAEAGRRGYCGNAGSNATA